MNVTEETIGRAVVLVCKGELTEESLPDLKRAVERAVRTRNAAPGASTSLRNETTGPNKKEFEVRDLVLNLEAAPFVDSAGLEYLLDLQERLGRRRGQVRLARMDENVVRIFKITRLDGLFERFDDVSEAVKAV